MRLLKLLSLLGGAALFTGVPWPACAGDDDIASMSDEVDLDMPGYPLAKA